jgi:hypothetical protein
MYHLQSLVCCIQSEYPQPLIILFLQDQDYYVTMHIPTTTKSSLTRRT